MKCDDLQRLKFGSLVNLEALETTDVNPQGVQLRAKLLDLEKQTAAKVKAEDEKIVQLQETYTQLIQSSTQRHRDVHDLHMDKRTLNDTLKAGRTAALSDDSIHVERAREERFQLFQIADSQSREIQILREEITRLARKGGTVPPPARSPRRMQAGQLPAI
eukprot:m.66648 g.66648  ORF g.66648 m.66648 type:complete len:161 (-) comp11821_c1_seq2:1815-2297(-)